jgi:hypothetical protein
MHTCTVRLRSYRLTWQCGCLPLWILTMVTGNISKRSTAPMWYPRFQILKTAKKHLVYVHKTSFDPKTGFVVTQSIAACDTIAHSQTHGFLYRKKAWGYSRNWPKCKIHLSILLTNSAYLPSRIPSIHLSQFSQCSAALSIVIRVLDDPIYQVCYFTFFSLTSIW